MPPVTIRHLTPGPGAYEAHSTIGKQSPKFSFRGKNLKLRTNDNPPPNAYHPNSTLTEFSAYKNIGFGFGNRTLLKHIGVDTPGPGSYNFGSSFDKKF